MGPITELVIRDDKSPDGGSDVLTAKIKDDGVLAIEGYDSGRDVKKVLGDWDYEFWITVPSQFKDTVLLHLLKDRFAVERDMKSWLDQKSIPHEFSSYT